METNTDNAREKITNFMDRLSFVRYYNFLKKPNDKPMVSAAKLIETV